MNSRSQRPRSRTRRRVRSRPAPSGSYLFGGLLGALLAGSAGVFLLISGLTTRPVSQVLFAAFPEGLLAPGTAEILVHFEEPFTRRPLPTQIRVLIEGSGRRKEVGLVHVEGFAAVPFHVPELMEGGYRLVVQALGGEREEELSADIDVDSGNRLVLMTDGREFIPGERVRVMGMGRRLAPARPAAGEPWAFTLVGPRGHRISRSEGVTDGGGCFQLDFDLPVSAIGGNYWLRVEVGSDLAAFREIQVLEIPQTLRVRPRLPGPYVQAGEVLEGELELFRCDGLPVLAGEVRVGVAGDAGYSGLEGDGSSAGGWVKATAHGPGLYAFALPIPPLGPDAAELLPVGLEARVLEPGETQEVRMPFRIHRMRDRHRLVLEAPAYWVEGLPHQVRLEVLDLSGRPRPASVEVLAGEQRLSRGEFTGEGALALTLIPPPGCERLLFRALGARGEKLCSRELALTPPPVADLDFSLLLEESILGPGQPLRLQVHSKRKEDMLWVDLLLEDMVMVCLPLAVRDQVGLLEIPAERIPAGFFQVRAWRWSLQEIPFFEVSCLARTHECLVVPLEGGFAGFGEPSAGFDLPGPSALMVHARAGPWTPYQLPEALNGALTLLPGTFGLSPIGRLQLLRALCGGAPLPSVRESLAPRIEESWSDYGPPILATAEGHLLYGFVLSGLALALAIGVLAVWLLRRSGGKAGGTVVALVALLMGTNLAAQQSRPALQRLQAQGFPAWWWGVESGVERLAAPQGVAPFGGGVQSLGMGGQSVRDGALLFGWSEWTWAPGWELRAQAQGKVWPGDEVTLGCWWRLAGDGEVPGTLLVAAGLGPALPVAFLGPWVWHQTRVPLGELEPGQESVPFLARVEGGQEITLGRLSISSPLGVEHRRSWSRPLDGFHRFLVTQTFHEEEHLGLRLLPGPRFQGLLLLRGLWAEKDSGWRKAESLFEAPWESIDRVLGWGRIALAFLGPETGNRLSPRFEVELRQLATRTLKRAWKELASYEGPGAGFGPFPQMPRDHASSAAALEFLVDARAYLSEPSAEATAERTARLLGLLVREDGSLPSDATALAQGLWSGAGEGRLYFSALCGAALARYRAKDFLFTNIEGFLTLGLQARTSLLERLAAARAFSSWDAAHSLGRTLLEQAAAEAQEGDVRAGLHTWHGAGGGQANLFAAARLASALSRAGLAPEVAARLRESIWSNLDPDLGWGDPWTTAACLEALLAGPSSTGRPGEARVMVGDREVWRGVLEEALTLDVGPRPGQGAFPVEIEGQAGGVALLVSTARTPPWTESGQGPLRVAWVPGSDALARLGDPVLVRLQVTNTAAETLSRILVEVQPSLAFTVLPDRLSRALRIGDVARASWSAGTTRLWLTHLPPMFTKNLAIRLLPTVQGKASLPPVTAVAVQRPGSWIQSVPTPLRIGG